MYSALRRNTQGEEGSQPPEQKRHRRITVTGASTNMHEVTRCAISTLFGPKVFETNPDLLDAFWEFDDHIFMLTLVFPPWLYPAPYQAHDRFLATIAKFWRRRRLGLTRMGPVLRPTRNRTLVLEYAGRLSSGSEMLGLVTRLPLQRWEHSFLRNQNSNTIPTTMWALIEVFRDKALLQALREEISVSTELLRLHMNFNIIRNLNEPITVERFQPFKGAMLQVPMLPAHYDESFWGSEGHPASEFWAEHHIEYEKRIDTGNVTRKGTFSGWET
ncbi:hypothetical protein VMCG_09080 [Cytospora schulzeri]|uniref:Uncharacterized protein n=1 Tax=Cytospora schulzeri TaxID=448051 RepID=A0A423VPB5_9PEZI|nr:hypothetical protein VMCG_09080 [Valsa malicola]